MFELIDRDGLARRGRIETPHGVLETPALLPVVHPDPGRQTVPPKELRETFGFGGVITSSYILHRQPVLRERARKEGLHRYLGFPGVIMTDSGAFQQHAWGQVEVSPQEILAFQGEIGSDIATLLDEFVEPEATREEAESGVETTVARAREARVQRPGKLLAVPVQGGLYPELRARSASAASELGDVLAIGGIVPLMEHYRFADLARVLCFARPHLAPEHPVHLFGLGHPMVFALGALLGGDLFDSSSYHKFAKRGTLLFPEGSLALEEVQEEVCGCSLCGKIPLTQLKDLPALERETHVARHNLLQCSLEISRVRQAIRDGEIWELAERRSTGHPALAAAQAELRSHPEVFLPTEPPSRRSFRVVLPGSLERPAVARFHRELSKWRRGTASLGAAERRPLSPSSLRNAPPLGAAGTPRWASWDVPTPMGLVPLELTEIYPVGPLVAPEEFRPWEHRPPKPMAPPSQASEVMSPPSATGVKDREATSEGWVDRHVASILAYAWGWEAVEKLERAGPLRARHSRSTGRLREIRRESDVLFIVGNDGLPRPTFRGGLLLKESLPVPRARVVAHSDAVPFVREGRSLFSRHVVNADTEIVPFGPVLVVDAADELLAVGSALLAGGEMGRFRRGVAVRVSSHAKGGERGFSEGEGPTSEAPQ
ncbi:MAG: tRNA guanosine(15) transglycosylase TgtA [Euryarchaeota archaeon]|nr:tRNA guanosine(15) transglycosylase TgtA [Euryarchaeota archaeon]MDE1835129.1 tRNA guanosine(15) transglycosylase TgtA [Euryarchaeota archaeon]MDE1880685.1 tRNA guanosine(15) transglycosylase TgtA [Euryarchaeota archaeon]MDE2044908.1 tRNA guanosine(15) transglycosylase TgtA [Thermoplasmata archaeon]